MKLVISASMMFALFFLFCSVRINGKSDSSNICRSTHNTFMLHATWPNGTVVGFEEKFLVEVMAWDARRVIAHLGCKVTL